MNWGEDARGVKSLFPPSAETVVGAFRAALARSKGWPGRDDWSAPLKEVLGDGFDELGKLSFMGPLLSKNGEPLFPCPRHLLLGKDGDNQEPSDWLRPSEPLNCDLGTAVRLPIPPPRSEDSPKLTESDDHFITLSGLKAVSKGELPTSNDLLKTSDLYVFETRVGIFRDEQTRTVGEASLYNPTFVRLKQGVGLLVGLSGLPEDWEIPSLFSMGGESRMARCARISGEPFEQLAGNASGRLLVSITPVISQSEDWHGPGPGDDASCLDPGLKGTVESVACARPVLVPSWDSIKGKGHPRSQLLAIPPGTVWWLSNSDSISGIQQIGARRRHGYGLVISIDSPKVLAKG